MPSAPMASSLSASCTTLNSGVISKDADEEKKALTNNEPEDLDELGRPRLGKGPDASTTRLTLPGQDDPPARVDAAADAPVEVPLQGSSPEGRGGCAIA